MTNEMSLARRDVVGRHMVTYILSCDGRLQRIILEARHSAGHGEILLSYHTWPRGLHDGEDYRISIDEGDENYPVLARLPLDLTCVNFVQFTSKRMDSM